MVIRVVTVVVTIIIFEVQIYAHFQGYARLTPRFNNKLSFSEILSLSALASLKRKDEISRILTWKNL